MESRAPRVGHKKSRNGCAQCKRRHVKCDEEKPCTNCVRHGVACSLAGGPNIPRDDVKPRRSPVTPVSIRSGSITTESDTQHGTEYGGASPLRHLTRSIEREQTRIHEQEWLSDLQLMHHFDTAYGQIMAEVDYAETCRHELPKLAFRSPYVMHIILAVSALHLAHTQPERGQALNISAVRHLDSALILYRQDDGPSTADNASARFCFSLLVAVFAYATHSTVSPIDAISEVFKLVQGIDSIVTESFVFLVSGPFSGLLNRTLHEAMRIGPDRGYLPLTAQNYHANICSVQIPQGMDFGLGHLDFLISMPGLTPEESQASAIMLGELKQVYSNIVQAQGSTSIGLVICWPKSDLTIFNSLIKRRNPQALILVAYYCVVLDLLDGRVWFLDNWGSRLLQCILDVLDPRWKTWLEWPIQTILIRKQAAITPVSMPDTTNLLL